MYYIPPFDITQIIIEYMYDDVARQIFFLRDIENIKWLLQFCKNLEKRQQLFLIYNNKTCIMPSIEYIEWSLEKRENLAIFCKNILGKTEYVTNKVIKTLIKSIDFTTSMSIIKDLYNICLQVHQRRYISKYLVPMLKKMSVANTEHYFNNKKHYEFDQKFDYALCHAFPIFSGR